MLVGFTLTLFIGQVTISDSVRIQQGILAAFLRVAMIFVLTLYVVTSSVREIQQQSMLVLLSLPIPRSIILFAKFLSYALISLVVVFLASIELSLFAPILNIIPWAITLWIESLIVIAFSLLCAFSFGQVPLAITVTSGFYLLSRSMSSILLIAHNPILHQDSIGQNILISTIDFIAFLLPDLDHYSKASSLMYGTEPAFGLSYLLTQGIIYISLLSMIALIDLYRKNF